MVIPYCGLPPTPTDLLERFNFDPRLMLVLCALALAQLRTTATLREFRLAAVGWALAFMAFVSPLCALSVSLFSARVAQHMILVLAAAPLIALAAPRVRASDLSWPLWVSAGAFFCAIWYWHMPGPYEATFASTFTYWCMHVTLFGSAIFLWRELLHPRDGQSVATLAAGILSSMQMGFLGAILTFAGRPLFSWHLLTTFVWGLTPLQDQQLGGALMWVPGVGLFLWVALRSLVRLWSALERVSAA